MEHHVRVRVSRPPHGELLHQPPDLLLGGDLLQGQDVPDAALRPRVQQHRVPVCAGDNYGNDDDYHDFYTIPFD